LPRRPLQQLLAIDVPAWLEQAVAPWTIEDAALWRAGGVTLALRSKLSQIPVLIEQPASGPLVISILDRRVAPGAGGRFVRALADRLEQTPKLRGWLRRLAELATILHDEEAAATALDGDLATLALAWLAWPERETDPSRQVPELPAEVHTLGLPRASRAALILYRFARGETLTALSEWEQLGAQASASTSASGSFLERLLDVVALGLLGRRAAAIRAAELAATLAHEPDEWLALARAYESLDDKQAAVAAHEQVMALRDHGWDQLRHARARGDFAVGDPVPRPDPDGTVSEQVSFVREVVKILDAAGRYDDMLTVIGELLDQHDQHDQIPADLVLRAAQLHLWRCEAELARARLAPLANDPHAQLAHLIEGALLVLEGQPERALALFETCELTGPEALELLLWQAEAHLARGETELALACVDRHIIRENTLAAYLLKLLVIATDGSPEALAGSIASRTFLDALILDVLPSLCSPESLAAAHADPSRFAALVRGILDDMGGNRSPHPTWRRRDTSGQPSLEPVAVDRSGREAAVDNLVRIRSDTPEDVIAGFAAVEEAYPSSPHPFTYQGELLIWLGRYDDALACFDEADRRAPTRWSYVGRAAAYDLLGNAERADHWTREGATRFGELETATTHVYRGERKRKLEDWDGARDDLEIALRVKSRRIGARINLALVARATGDKPGWARAIEQLEIDATAYLWEAGARRDHEYDEPTLLRALELMAGNRSSFLHTMIDANGQWRVVPPPSRWVAHARLCVALGRRELEPLIAARWLART
jgi:tetratricopeptide (TPR) repeat protein